MLRDAGLISESIIGALAELMHGLLAFGRCLEKGWMPRKPKGISQPGRIKLCKQAQQSSTNTERVLSIGNWEGVLFLWTEAGYNKEKWFSLQGYIHMSGDRTGLHMTPGNQQDSPGFTFSFHTIISSQHKDDKNDGLVSFPCFRPCVGKGGGCEGEKDGILRFLFLRRRVKWKSFPRLYDLSTLS